MRSLLLPILLATCTANLAAADAPRPNIVFILADDLGYGDLGCYGQRLIPTPNLDRLAAEGMRFTQFYAGSPVCAPSRSVLLTGQHAGHTRIRGNSKLGLLPEDHTVAQMLQEAGYATSLIGKWGLGGEGTDALPTRKGFDHFFGYLDQTHAHNYYPTFLVRDEQRVPLDNVVPDEGRYGQGVATERRTYSHDLLAREALDTLGRAAPDRPFFLYLAFTLPHANNERRNNGSEIPDYGAFKDRDWPDVEKGFAAMVARLDHDVGLILDRLRERGLAENTLVIFASDNGPHAEGGHDAKFFHSAGPLRGIKRDVYEGGIRVPLIVRWPGRVAAGTVSDQTGYFGDFMATFAELAGAKLPAQTNDGVSLAPLLLAGKPPAARDYLYWEFYEGASAQAVRFGDWKAVRSPMFTGPVQLFDLARDPGEKTDLAAAQPAEVARARRYMEEAHVPSPLWKVGAP